MASWAQVMWRKRSCSQEIRAGSCGCAAGNSIDLNRACQSATPSPGLSLLLHLGLVQPITRRRNHLDASEHVSDAACWSGDALYSTLHDMLLNFQTVDSVQRTTRALEFLCV